MESDQQLSSSSLGRRYRHWESYNTAVSVIVTRVFSSLSSFGDLCSRRGPRLQVISPSLPSWWVTVTPLQSKVIHPNGVSVGTTAPSPCSTSKPFSVSLPSRFRRSLVNSGAPLPHFRVEYRYYRPICVVRIRRFSHTSKSNTAIDKELLWGKYGDSPPSPLQSRIPPLTKN